MNAFLVVVAFVYGTIIGSFLNVVIWRLPRQERLGGRSRCPQCRKQLGARHLVPLLSYIAQHGQCVHCGKRISKRYPLIEFITGALFALAAITVLASGTGPLAYWELVRWLFIIAILVVIFVIDLEHYLILDTVVFPAAITLLGFNIVLDLATGQSLLLLSSHTLGGIVGAVLGAGAFYLLWFISQGRWMGFGDVKFNSILGLALGFPGIIVGLFLAFMLGAMAGIILIVSGRKSLQSRVPFGTFLSVGAFLALLYGPIIARWYLGLLGWY